MSASKKKSLHLTDTHLSKKASSKGHEVPRGFEIRNKGNR